MGGDSESAFKNTPIQITIMPSGPFHKNFLKIWASDLVGALSPRREITVVLRISKRRRFLMYPMYSYVSYVIIMIKCYKNGKQFKNQG